MRSSHLLLIAAAVMPITANAQTETTHKDWGEAGGWAIRVDPSVGNGCYIERSIDGDTLVQVGFVPDRNGGFFAAYNPAWTHIEAGFEGTVEFDFEDSLFAGDYVGVVEGDRRGGYAFFNNPEFIKEFGKRNDVSIKGESEGALNFKLTGTAAAINAMRVCDSEQSKEP